MSTDNHENTNEQNPPGSQRELQNSQFHMPNSSAVRAKRSKTTNYDSLSQTQSYNVPYLDSSSGPGLFSQTLNFKSIDQDLDNFATKTEKMRDFRQLKAKKQMLRSIQQRKVKKRDFSVDMLEKITGRRDRK